MTRDCQPSWHSRRSPSPLVSLSIFLSLSAYLSLGGSDQDLTFGPVPLGKTPTREGDRLCVVLRGWMCVSAGAYLILMPPPRLAPARRGQQGQQGPLPHCISKRSSESGCSTSGKSISSQTPSRTKGSPVGMLKGVVSSTRKTTIAFAGASAEVVHHGTLAANAVKLPPCVGGLPDALRERA